MRRGQPASVFTMPGMCWRPHGSERPGNGPGWTAARSFRHRCPFLDAAAGFLFLIVIISIQANGESIAQQRASRRDGRAVSFREVQRTLAGTGVTNLMAGIAGTVPYIVNPGIVAYTQTTGVASRRVGYCIGGLLIALAFLPKVSGLLSSIPGSVMAGYLIVPSAYLFIDGARTVIQSEQNRQRITVAGVRFWIGAAFQFELFSMPEIVPVWGTLLQSGITTGGVAAIVMILYLELPILGACGSTRGCTSTPCRSSTSFSTGLPVAGVGTWL